MQHYWIMCSLFLLIVIPVNSYSAPPGPPGDSPPLITDRCALVSPDKMLYVPQVFTSAVFMSESGEYFYRGSNTPIYAPHPCNYFVVDVLMATYSNKQPAPNGSPSNVHVSYHPFDIPGSEAYGDFIPVGMEDCKRLTAFARFYVKRSNEIQFKLMETETVNGNWTEEGKCVLQTSLHVANPSASGWDTYRFAVAIKERSSGQEVQVIVNQPPPL